MSTLLSSGLEEEVFSVGLKSFLLSLTAGALLSALEMDANLGESFRNSQDGLYRSNEAMFGFCSKNIK
jgi:hypothetical protein